MGRKKRAVDIVGTLPKNYDFRTGGSGPNEVPHGGDGNVGQPGVQGTPGILPVDRVPKINTPQPNLAELVDPNVSNAGTHPGQKEVGKFDPNFSNLKPKD